MKRNDFILSLKQGFNMEHTLEPISVSRWPLSPVQAEFLDTSGILRHKEAMPALNVIYLVFAVNEN
jgi:hypothetical protein